MEGQTCEYRNEKRLVKALIIPTITYGSETWTMTKKMRKKINVCEMYNFVHMEEDAENIMDGEKDQRLGAHGHWN